MIVTLTDFGNSEYLGVMKGVILSINPRSQIVDLCNTISHQKVREGAWILSQNYKYFPRGTIFLCVVDPGVGSERKPIVIETENYYFVGPDNGLMFAAAKADNILRIIHIKYLDKIKVSSTFHGRDIFSRVAAKMDEKIFLEEMGDVINEVERLEFFRNNREGEVVRIDHFGNIITNLPKLDKDEYTVTFGKKKLKMKFYKTYEIAPDKKMFVIEGSSGTLELAIKNSSADRVLAVRPGDRINIS